MDLNRTTIATSTTLGNGLFSTVDLHPGDAIIIIHKPLLLIAENQATQRVCANCFVEGGEGVNLEPCSQCGVVRFCGDDCEKSSFKPEGFHKAECGFLGSKNQNPFEHSQAQISAQAITNPASAMKNMLPTAVRATIQLVSRPSTLAKDSPFMELISHEDELRKNQSKWDDILLQAHAVTNFLQLKPQFVKDAVESLCRLSTNAFRVESNIGNGPIGICLDPLLARANHRCHPNSSITFDGKRATLRALSPIAKGEQVFLSYIDETQRREVRQAALAETWFFNCNCDRCSFSSSVYSELMTYPTISTPILDNLVPFRETFDFAKSRVAEEDPKTITRLFSLLHVLRHIEATIPNAHKSYQNIDRRLDVFKKALGSLDDFVLLQRYAQQPLPMILNEIYLIFLGKAEYISALIILVYLICHADPINYPSPYHPQRVTRLLALQRLLKLLASYDPEILQKFAMHHGIPANILCEMDWVSACQMVLYVLREVGNKCWGEDSGVMRGVEVDVKDVEGIQGKRGDGMVGTALMEWGRGKGGLGAVYAERLGVGLRSMAPWVWNVVGFTRERVAPIA
ncbi:hypothetical protein DSL72_002483 [Monilinia vaccinii-corymbosi]|uniref:MYND-type zinc finger protein samB n=1 Tax=Monilinia vaccinii-corymbosi TaxID=61207 RepID=A0A8A3PCM7_9HELO|nr:hypothetical protein DSL72_002483 [Monilinia vaccinii-corymbosi]